MRGEERGGRGEGGREGGREGGDSMSYGIESLPHHAPFSEDVRQLLDHRVLLWHNHLIRAAARHTHMHTQIPVLTENTKSYANIAHAKRDRKVVCA